MTIEIPDPITVKDLAAALACRPFLIVADLLQLKKLLNIQSQLDFETAAHVAARHGVELKKAGSG
jgi:hypothetical protein